MSSLPSPKSFRGLGLEHLLDALQFSEVVSGAHRSEGLIEVSGLQRRVLQLAGQVPLAGVLQPEVQF